jgi:transposase
MAQTAEQITISKGDRELMEALLRAGNTSQKVAFRINIVLGAAADISNSQLARDFATTKSSVLKWRGRFASSGLSGILEDAPRSGRKENISPEKEAAIVEATLHSRPKDATHWSTRSMADAQGISDTTVYRIWKAHRLQPHRVETFKFSRDPQFVDKLRDVVGLYLNPQKRRWFYVWMRKARYRRWIVRNRRCPCVRVCRNARRTITNGAGQRRCSRH